MADILKHGLNMAINVETKEGAVLLDELLAEDDHIQRLGRGGDHDAEDAIVDWRQAESTFNGRKRDKAKSPLGARSAKNVPTS